MPTEALLALGMLKLASLMLTFVDSREENMRRRSCRGRGIRKEGEWLRRGVDSVVAGNAETAPW